MRSSGASVSGAVAAAYSLTASATPFSWLWATEIFRGSTFRSKWARSADSTFRTVSLGLTSSVVVDLVDLASGTGHETSREHAWQGGQERLGALDGPSVSRRELAGFGAHLADPLGGGGPGWGRGL